MTTTISQSIDISHDIDTVYAFVADTAKTNTISKAVISAHNEPDAPLQVGDKWSVMMNMMGQEVEIQMECVETDPPHKIVRESQSPMGTINTVWQLEAVEGATNLSYSVIGNMPEGVPLDALENDIYEFLTDIRDAIES